jgi:hypothetical protein
MICPNCGAQNLKRSHSRNVKERFLKLFGQMAFRCQNCDWRGILKVPGRSPLGAREWLKWILIYSLMTLVIYLLAVTYSGWSAFLSKKPLAIRIGIFITALLLAGVAVFKIPGHSVLRIILVTLAFFALLMSIPAVFF